MQMRLTGVQHHGIPVLRCELFQAKHAPHLRTLTSDVPAGIDFTML